MKLTFISVGENQCASLFLSDLAPVIYRGQKGVVYTVSEQVYESFLTRYLTHLKKRAHPKYDEAILKYPKRLRLSLWVEVFRAQMCELEISSHRGMSATFIVPDDERFYPNMFNTVPVLEPEYEEDALAKYSAMMPRSARINVSSLSDYNRQVFNCACWLWRAIRLSYEEDKET